MTKWWRIELSASGNLVSVVECAGAGKGGSSVFYVSAASKEAAAYRAQRIQANEKLKARRAEHRRNGRCRCGRDRDAEQHLRCAVCRERAEVDMARMNARAAGEKVETPSKAPAFQERRAGVREGERLATLLEVLKWWQDAADNKSFTEKLKAEIAKLTGVRAA